MVSRWEEEYPSEYALVHAPPQREDVAISVVHKVFLLVSIVALVVGLWALTSAPTGDRETADATLGPPMGANVQLNRTTDER